MMLLALEFSSNRRSVALARGETVLAEAVDESGGRGTPALGLIETVLAQAGVAREAVEAIAVGLGPGSYTGVRAAIAVAYGWQLARAVKLLGVSSAEALAWTAREAGMAGRVHTVMDAQRGEFYLAEWDLATGSGTGGSPVQCCKALSPLRIVTAAELAAQRARGGVFVGPEETPPLFPSAAMVAKCAGCQPNGQPDEKGDAKGDALEPIYLRETQFVKAKVSQFC